MSGRTGAEEIFLNPVYLIYKMKKRIEKKFLLPVAGLFLIVSSVGSVLGATYYVDTSGTDGSSCGSISSPCKTLSYTCNNRASVSGDTIHINAGDYVDTGQCLLSVGINIEGAGQASTIINSDFAGGSDRCNGVYICMYTVMSSQPNENEGSSGTAIVAQDSLIHDFTIVGTRSAPTWAIRSAGRDNIAIYNMNIHNTGRSAIRMEGYYLWNSQTAVAPKHWAQNDIVRDCTIYNNTRVNTDGAIELEGIGSGSKFYDNHIDESQYMGTGEAGRGFKLGSAGWYSDVQIYNNFVRTSTGNGNNFVFELYNFQNDSKIYDNDFIGPLSLNGGRTTRISGSNWNLQIYHNIFNVTGWNNSECFQELSHNWLLFDRNFVVGNTKTTYPSANGLGIWTTNYLTASSVSHVQISNNVIYNHQNWGIRIAHSAHYDDIKILNNVIAGIHRQYRGSGIYAEDNPVITNLVVKNNLFMNNDWSWIGLSSGVSGAVISYNMLYNNGNDNDYENYGSGNTFSNNMVATPEIAGSGDMPAYFKPSGPGSNLVNAGTSLAGINDIDYDSVTRPQGSAWDIGAYEYISGTPPSSTCTSGADSDGDSVVSNEELAYYISEWKQGNINIGELITAIAEWKNGC